MAGVEFDSLTHALGMAGQMFFLDLLLSGDNALVIALVCRSLPPSLRARAIMLGTGLAILLRVVLTTIASFLLNVPLLKLVGAVLLLIIAIKLLLADNEPEPDLAPQPEANQLGSAVMVVVMADLALSLDNVVALAAASQGSTVFLAAGLLLSMPILMYGSLFIARLLEELPLLVPAGSAMLGWIAGQVAVSDPLIASWVDSQAPALSVVVPTLCVIFVVRESRIIRAQRQHLIAPPPMQLLSRLAQRLSQLGEAENPGATAPTTAPRAAPAAIETAVAAPLLPSVPVAMPVAAATAPALPPAAATRSRAQQADPPRQPAISPRTESMLLTVAAWAAAGIGLICLGWIAFHLLSQGFLPAPAHPGKPLA